jgi:lysophospholipase
MQSASGIFAPRFISAKSGAKLRVATFEANSEAKPRGVCVLLSGQTEFIEKYFEVIDELRERGFQIVTTDWRGHGASTRALPDSLKAHVGDFSEYDDDLASLMDQVVRPLTSKAPIALAHSMGGHILLRTLHAKPHSFACTVLSAPMIAVSTRGYPAWIVGAVTSFMNLRGAGDDYVWGMDGRDPIKMTFDQQIVTSDRARFKRTKDYLAANPDIRLSGPTWRWLGAASRSMDLMRAPGYGETITTPTLFCGAGKDRIVVTKAEEDLARRMPRCEFALFEDAEHEILMENDSIRARFWDAFDAFVGKYV